MICKENPLQTDDVVDLVADLGGFGNDLRILAATKAGPAGVEALNARFHAIMAAGRPALRGFSEGEPLIFLKNDYRRDLRNGSLGVVTEIRQSVLAAEFDGVEHEFAGASFEPGARLRHHHPQGAGQPVQACRCTLSCRRACSTARWSTRRSPERSRPPS